MAITHQRIANAMRAARRKQAAARRSQGDQRIPIGGQLTKREKRLEQKISAMSKTLYWLISWMSQSANSPISPREAALLLTELTSEE